MSLCLIPALHLSINAAGELPYHSKQDTALKLSQPLSLRWKFDSGAILIASPAYNSQTAFMVLEKGVIVALNVQEGAVRWRTEVGGVPSSKPVADEHAVYVATQTKNNNGTSRVTLRAISSVSGVTLWIKEIPDNARFLMVNGTNVVTISHRGKILAMDKSSGNQQWSRDLASAVLLDAKIANDKLYISTPEAITQISLTDGTITRSYQTLGVSFEHLCLDKNLIYGSTNGKTVTAFDWAAMRIVWRTKLDTTIKSIVLVDNVLVATSTNNYVYGFSVERGKRRWKRDIGGRILAEPLALSGSVLLAPLSGETCIVLDVRQGRVQNLVPVGQSNTAASPVVVGNILLLPVQNGLRAYTSQPVLTSATSPTLPGQSSR